MIDLNRVGKIYGAGALAHRALEEVSFKAESGEVVVVMGPSGSGKTTLLSILGCVLSPTSGSVKLLGREVAGVPESRLPDLRLRYVGFVFQSHNLIEALSVVENVKLPLLLRRRGNAAAQAEALELLDLLDLAEHARRMPRDLSGGQKQRVSIARALAGRPPILLADEPTAALDARTGQRVMDALAQLAHAAGHAVVVVTHDARIAGQADRTVYLEDGRIREG